MGAIGAKPTDFTPSVHEVIPGYDLLARTDVAVFSGAPRRHNDGLSGVLGIGVLGR